MVGSGLQYVYVQRRGLRVPQAAPFTLALDGREQPASVPIRYGGGGGGQEWPGQEWPRVCEGFVYCLFETGSLDTLPSVGRDCRGTNRTPEESPERVSLHMGPASRREAASYHLPLKEGFG